MASCIFLLSKIYFKIFELFSCQWTIYWLQGLCYVSKIYPVTKSFNCVGSRAARSLIFECKSQSKDRANTVFAFYKMNFIWILPQWLPSFCKYCVSTYSWIHASFWSIKNSFQSFTASEHAVLLSLHPFKAIEELLLIKNALVQSITIPIFSCSLSNVTLHCYLLVLSSQAV